MVKIVWKECATPEDAIELERSLLLEHRPPFNRAGVWKVDPWWLKIEATTDRLNLELVREECGTSPLPSSFRYVLSLLFSVPADLSLSTRSIQSCGALDLLTGTS